MATLAQYEKSNDLGFFCVLTNSYCLVAPNSKNFIKILTTEIQDRIPILKTTISGTRNVGSFCCGNSKGLLVPNNITDTELKYITENIPEGVKVTKIDYKLNTLGNCIACNDNVALIHTDFDEKTEDLIADTLGVEVFRQCIAKKLLCGSYCALSNNGALLHPETKKSEQDELSNLLQVPVVAGTVNRGSDLIGGGIVVNDFCAFAGLTTTANELKVIETIFNFSDEEQEEILSKLLDIVETK